MQYQLRISGHHYELLKEHLLSVDGKEAVAVALCGRFSDSEKIIILVHQITLIPYADCKLRKDDVINWPTDRIHDFFEKINTSDFAILKIHSHPNGLDKFSRTDDCSDIEFFESVFGWAITDKPHASAIMLPDGKIFGRFFLSNLEHKPIDTVQIAGDTILQFSSTKYFIGPQFAKRTIQAFGDKTYQMISNMTVGVIGCSGTGSPVIEQLTRLGVGKLILVDPDTIEHKNLNRILNSTMEDVLNQTPKVTALANAIEKVGLKTKVSTHKINLYDSINTLKALVKCDIIFGCMDSVDGRHLLNQLCSYYLLPYFDLGVKLEADGNGGILKICGTVHYIQPCKSSLLSRGVYTMDDLRASSQFRKNPQEYENLKRNSYIKNINVNSPAVISVNMQIASHAINEFLNRVHSYKSEHPSCYAGSTIDITEGFIVNSNESEFETDCYLTNKCGKGDTIPYIDIPELIK